MTISKGFVKKLDNQLNLKISAGSDNDFQRLINFNTTIHGAVEEEFTKYLCYEHPNRDEILWFYIEEGEMLISSMAFLPLRWDFEDLNLKIGEMGMVGTLEDYRGQGLFGKMNEIYEQTLIERGYFISALRGIPYYYRKFGYEFLLPLNQRVKLPLDKIPTHVNNSLMIRKADNEDIPVIQKLCEANYSNSLISNKFDPVNFAHKYINDENSNYKFTTYIMEGSDSIAFFSIGSPFGKSKDLILSSEMTSDQILKCFQFIKSINEKEIIIDQNLDSTISRYAANLGGEKNKGWEWQIKILSHQKFFDAIKPVLEERISKSEFSNLTKIVEISNYRESIRIEFIDGSIKKIDTYTGYPESKTCDLRIPGSLLTKVLFGDKSVDEVNHLFPDAMVKPDSIELIDILFPKLISFPGSDY